MTSWLETIHDYYWDGSNPPFTITTSYKISQKSLHFMRIAFFLLQVCITSHIIWLHGALVPLLKYLTIWGCLLCTFYFLIVSIMGSSPPQNPKAQTKLLNTIWKSTHILFEVTLALQFVICIFFWVIIAPLKPDLINGYNHLMVSNILLHVVTPLFMWIEAYYNYIKVYGRHAWWVVKVMIIYGGFNAYIALNYGSVYPLMNWIDAITYVFALIGVGITLFGFFLGYKLSQRKEKNLSFVRFYDPHHEERKKAY